MQNPSALFGMLSHCQTPTTFADFPGLSLSAFGGKADVCPPRRAGGSGGFGSLVRRSPHDGPTHMNCAGQKAVGAPGEKAHLAAIAPRSCLSFPAAQGRGGGGRVLFSCLGALKLLVPGG